jgi:hypothetical protein
MKQIYPDTNIWNALCKQSVDPLTLMKDLEAKNATLVLSLHTVYELARTFASNKSTSHAQGMTLFQCLEKFIKAGIVCSKQIMDLVGDEAVAYFQHQTSVNPLLDATGRAITLTEVSKLAAGVVEPRVTGFISNRATFAADSRTDQKDHFVGNPAMKAKLTAIPESTLSGWLSTETISTQGQLIISDHLSRITSTIFPQSSALSFLSSAIANASKAVVRADLYSNWRCANRNSNPKDLLDDMLHVLQAVYSHIYVTEEAGQLDYAKLLLPPSVKVAIYNKTTPIDQWLLALV